MRIRVRQGHPFYVFIWYDRQQHVMHESNRNVRGQITKSLLAVWNLRCETHLLQMIWFPDNHIRQICCISFRWCQKKQSAQSNSMHSTHRHPIPPIGTAWYVHVLSLAVFSRLNSERQWSVWSEQPLHIMPDEMLSCVVSEWFVSLRE